MKVKNILAPVIIANLPAALALYEEIRYSSSAPSAPSRAETLREIARLRRVWKETASISFQSDPYAPTAWVAEAIFNARACRGSYGASSSEWSAGVWRAARAGYCLHLD